MKLRLLNKLLLATACLLLLQCKNSRIDSYPSPVKQHEAEYSVEISGQVTNIISPFLLGFNIVYAYEADSIWNDGKLTAYLKDVHTSIIRYPGGTVSTYYHWNELTGEGWKDSWNPTDPVTPKDVSQFMTLDQYMSVIRETHATPLLGINMCSGWRWNRMEDGISEALDLMIYCEEKDFNVEYWYLGNEPYQEDSNGGKKTIEQYAGLINAYVPRMKELNPDIKIVVNWNAAFKNREKDYQTLLSLAGENIDIIDVHWYWSWTEPSWEKWLASTPMKMWTGDSYLQEIEFFRQMTEEMGFPDLKLASLEWNVGPIRNKQLSPHQCAFIQSEMLMIFMMGGMDMATFWPIHGPGTSVSARSFYDPVNRNHQPNYHIFSFLGELQGKRLLKMDVSEEFSNIVNIAASNEDESIIWICMINKNSIPVKSTFSSGMLKKMKPEVSNAFILKDMGNSSELIPIQLKHNKQKNEISLMVPENSITLLKFKKSV